MLPFSEIPQFDKVNIAKLYGNPSAPKGFSAPVEVPWAFKGVSWALKRIPFVPNGSHGCPRRSPWLLRNEDMP